MPFIVASIDPCASYVSDWRDIPLQERRPVIDAYYHLDADQPSPLADVEHRLSLADLAGAFLVETWDGRNRPALDDVLRRGLHNFSVALCYRRAESNRLLRSLHTPRLGGIRMSDCDIDHGQIICRELSELNKILLVHTAGGIGPLSRVITRLCIALPQLKIYVPHLAWPTAKGNPDKDWRPAVKDLAAMTNVTFGISAIAHFSREPFPHDDIRYLALGLISQVPPSRLVVGSDYPLCPKEQYVDYIDLARGWVESMHPHWRVTDPILHSL